MRECRRCHQSRANHAIWRNGRKSEPIAGACHSYHERRIRVVDVLRAAEVKLNAERERAKVLRQEQQAMTYAVDAS